MEGSNDTIDIQETLCPLHLLEYEELMRLVPALAESTNYGIDLYEETLNFVYVHCNM